MSGSGNVRANRQQRASAQIAWSNAGAPDPFEWLAARWAAMATDKRMKPGSDSDKAQRAEDLALKLLPYLHAKLKQTEIDVTSTPEFTVIIGGNDPNNSSG